MLTTSRSEYLAMRDPHPAPSSPPADGHLNLTRRMQNDDDDQFHVDLTILDFLVFKATALVFEWTWSSDPYHSDLPSALVSMTADWRVFLSHKHHGRHLGPTAALRSRLLQFTLLATHRLHHTETWTTPDSLAALHDQNRARAAYWSSRTTHPPALEPHTFNTTHDFPLTHAALHANRRDLADHLAIPSDQRPWVDDPVTITPPSLHCLLPLLLELTAARMLLDDDWAPTSDCFDLLGQFMLHAILEAYLRNGAHDTTTFNTICALGCPGIDRWADEPPSITAMRTLFSQEGLPLVEQTTWTQTRTRYITELLPQSRTESHLQALHRAHRCHPYRAFQQRLLSFLHHLHDGLVKPDLAQVEEGRITIHGSELSERESRDMIARMGL